MAGKVEASTSTTQDRQPQIQSSKPGCLIKMEAVDRISKLPAVESTLQTAGNIYGKVKGCNIVINWSIRTAESTVNRAMGMTRPVCAPVARTLQWPIKKVDGVLCTGLDFVERQVPCVKQPPREVIFQLITSTKDFVNQKLDAAAAFVKPAVETAHSYVDPVVAAAHSYVDPMVEAAHAYVDPMVQPALDMAHELKELGVEKVHDLLHQHHGHGPNETNPECRACQAEEREKSSDKAEDDEY